MSTLYFSVGLPVPEYLKSATIRAAAFKSLPVGAIVAEAIAQYSASCCSFPIAGGHDSLIRRALEYYLKAHFSALLEQEQLRHGEALVGNPGQMQGRVA
jgi:hypothetical protein